MAVDHNQLRKMASDTVDPIDWSTPPPYTGQYPLSYTYCTVQCWLQITRLAALSEPRSCDHRNARPTHCLCSRSGFLLSGCTGRHSAEYSAVCRILRSNVWGLAEILSDLTVASSQYDILFWSQICVTCRSCWFPVSVALSCCGMAAYVRDGYGTFRPPKFE